MLRRTILLCRVAGCPARVHWSALVIVLLVALTAATTVLPAAAPGHHTVTYWLVSVPAGFVFLCGLFVHEFAHALVAQRHQLGVSSVTVWMLGGVTELDEEPRDALADLQVAVAGPLASLLVALGLVLCAAQGILFGVSDVVTSALLWVAVVNALVAMFNLLPAEPLDGGRALRAVLWKLCDDRMRAQRITVWSGRVLGVALICAGIVELLLRQQLGGAWLVLLGSFLVWAAGVGRRVAARRLETADASVRLTRASNSS